MNYVGGNILDNLSTWLLPSLIATWVIGITPPLIIRYKVAKRALPISSTLLFAFGLIIFNKIIFEFVGNKGVSVGVLLLIAGASALILRKQETVFNSEFDHEPIVGKLESISWALWGTVLLIGGGLVLWLLPLIIVTMALSETSLFYFLTHLVFLFSTVIMISGLIMMKDNYPLFAVLRKAPSGTTIGLLSRKVYQKL
jgi:hypothetical protein